MPKGWGHFEISIGLVADQLVVTAESVVKPGEAVPLYQVDGRANDHTDEIRVAYNNFKRGKTSLIFLVQTDKPFSISSKRQVDLSRLIMTHSASFLLLQKPYVKPCAMWCFLIRVLR